MAPTKGMNQKKEIKRLIQNWLTFTYYLVLKNTYRIRRGRETTYMVMVEFARLASFIFISYAYNVNLPIIYVGFRFTPHQNLTP